MQKLYNLEKKKDAYTKLKKYHKKLLDFSDIWNWNTLACLSRPSLERLLYLSNIYKLSMDNPGDIFEFGAHYGASTSILNNLKKIFEPNSSRKIHTFDTFDGFQSIEEEDNLSINEDNKIGDFKPEIENYEEFLETILHTHESLDLSISTKSSFTINKGPIEETLPNFFKAKNSLCVSLAIFDMDLFKPTLESLEIIKPHLLNGSYLIFDQFSSFDQFPGEGLAVKQCSYFDRLTPVKIFPKVPCSAAFIYKS